MKLFFLYLYFSLNKLSVWINADDVLFFSIIELIYKVNGFI